MNLLVKNKHLLTLLLRNIIIIMAGYYLWYILGQSATTNITFSAPLFVYNMHESDTINAPATILLTVQAKRSDITNSAIAQCSVHLDRETLKEGDNTSLIRESDIVLSSGLVLLDYTPETIPITLSKK